MPNSDKKIIVIAGPNGAGKTTFAKTFLPQEAHTLHFINADLIAAGLASWTDRPKLNMILTAKDIRNSEDPDIAGSYYALQRAGQAVIDLAIQTNTAIVTTINGKIVLIPAAELIKQRQNIL